MDTRSSESLKEIDDLIAKYEGRVADAELNLKADKDTLAAMRKIRSDLVEGIQLKLEFL